MGLFLELIDSRGSGWILLVELSAASPRRSSEAHPPGSGPELVLGELPDPGFTGGHLHPGAGLVLRDFSEIDSKRERTIFSDGIKPFIYYVGRNQKLWCSDPQEQDPRIGDPSWQLCPGDPGTKSMEA